MDSSKLNAAAIAAVGDAETSFGARVWRILTLGDRLGRRTALVIWMAAAIGLGLFAGWGWIVAAGLASTVSGLASTVLAFLPCAAMCALGLCGGNSGKECSGKTAPGAPPETNR